MSTRHRAPVEAPAYVPASGEASDVELMPAGDVTEGVVRVGGTVRRPHQPQSLAVAEYLDWLEDAGFDGSPRFLGSDREGRDVLTFVAGQCAGAVPETCVQPERMRYNAAALGGGWARMWVAGVGDMISRRRLWLEANAGRMVDALTG